jgi:hypothetical protein
MQRAHQGNSSGLTRRFGEACTLVLFFTLVQVPQSSAQFFDGFDDLKLDPQGGWTFQAGDGTATMDVRQGGPGFASIFVDATTDKRGIWWALIERNVSDKMDLRLMQKPGHEFRIEARVRSSHAPRRVNLQVLTQKTTDYDSNLMEYDIPDTANWHTISMTTRGFDAKPGDTIIGHLALMDWGLEKYRLDVDYIKVDIVDTATAGPDQGEAVPYHPPIADPKSFNQKVKVAADSSIDIENTDINLNDWYVQDAAGHRVNLLTVDGTHYMILRWNLRQFAGKKVVGHGLLELTTNSVQQKAERLKDFGIVRVVEILGGDPNWDQTTVTTDSLCHYEHLSRVLNTQMIIDWPITEGNGGKTYLTIGHPVLQRLIDGKTLGIAIKPLGALNASFYSMEYENGKNSAQLYFNAEE